MIFIWIRYFLFFRERESIQNEFIVSKKYALVSELVKLYFFWTRPPVKHYIDDQAWWMKLYEHIDGVVPAFTEFADGKTIDRLRALDVSVLKELFHDTDPENSIVNEEFYIGILERRDAMCRVLKVY